MTRHNHLADNQHLVPEGFEPFEEEPYGQHFILRYRHPDSRWHILCLDQAGKVVDTRTLDPRRRGETLAAGSQVQSIAERSHGPGRPPRELRRLEYVHSVPGGGAPSSLPDPAEAFIDVASLDHEDFVHHHVFWAEDVDGRRTCYRCHREDLVDVALLVQEEMTVRELDERLASARK